MGKVLETKTDQTNKLMYSARMKLGLSRVNFLFRRSMGPHHPLGGYKNKGRKRMANKWHWRKDHGGIFMILA